MREKKVEKCPKCGGEMEKGKECKRCGHMELRKEMSLRIELGYISLFAGIVLVGVVWFINEFRNEPLARFLEYISDGVLWFLLITAIALIFAGLALAGKHFEQVMKKKR